MNDETTDDLDITTDEATDASTEWLAATIVGTDEDAALIAGFLNSNGIPAQVESLHASEFPADFGRLGEVHVMVPAERLDEAQQLLAQSEAETPPADDGD
jgi:hypothetical protein